MNDKNQIVTGRKLKLDGHAHVFTKALPMASARRYTPQKDALANVFFSYLKDAGLDGALLVQPSFLGTDNSYMLNVLKEAKETADAPTIYGVAMLDPKTSYEEMQSLKEKGIIGVRLNLVECDLPDFMSDDWKLFLNNLERLNWHLEVHLEGSRQTDLLKTLPYTGNIVIDHFGLPSSLDQLKRNLDFLISNPKFNAVYTKISAAYRVFPNDSFDLSLVKSQQYADTLIQALGTQNLIWGSDWPWTRHEKGQSYKDCTKWGKQWLGPDYAVMPNELF